MDRPTEATLRRSLLILAAVILVTAWFSETFYFPDEHYQVLEFMAFKLGITPGADLPWEFSARIRPWFQPMVYFLIAKPLMLMGVKDMFVLAFVLRLMTGLFSLLALAAFARAQLPTMEGDEEKRAFVRYLPLFGFLPYLFVRTSSETFSTAFLLENVPAKISQFTLMTSLNCPNVRKSIGSSDLGVTPESFSRWRTSSAARRICSGMSVSHQSSASSAS